MQHFRKLNQAGFDHVLVITAFMVVFALVGTTLLIQSHAAGWSGELQIGLNKSLCLNNLNDSKTIKTPIDLYPCNGTQAQSFKIEEIGTSTNRFLIKAASANLCVDDTGDGVESQPTKPVYVETYTCNSSDHAQEWEWTGAGAHELENYYSHGCLNDPNNSEVKGTTQIVYSCATNSSNELWYEATFKATSGSSGSSSSSSSSNSSPNGQLPKPDKILNFSHWVLQEPVVSGSSVLTIPSSKLVTGYSDQYLYTSSTPNGDAVTFFTPENGAHTTNSSYPRTELRELNSNGTNANWNMVGTNILTASLEATNISDHTVIGQVHIGSPLPGTAAANSTKPLLKLYYYANGSLIAGLEKSPSGSQSKTTIGNIPLRTKFTYMIRVSGDTITIKLNSNTPIVLTASSSFNKYGMYFKAGDYLQTTGSSSTVGARDEFYSLSVQH